jgi:hypothetical protein
VAIGHCLLCPVLLQQIKQQQQRQNALHLRSLHSAAITASTKASIGSRDKSMSIRIEC